MYGVPYELFWHLNPIKLEPFRNAYQKKMDYDAHMAWLNGNYVRIAIASAFNPQKVPYPKDPAFKPVANTGNDGVKESAEIQALRFREWAEVFNKKFEANKGVE